MDKVEMPEAVCPKCHKSHKVEALVAKFNYPVVCNKCRKKREETEAMIASTKKYLDGLTNGGRLEFINELMEGYCRACGIKEDGFTCHCWDDA